MTTDSNDDVFIFAYGQVVSTCKSCDIRITRIQGLGPSLATNPIFEVSPPLPDGLNMNWHNGTISGTPTETHANTTHTVTVTAFGATTTETFTLMVIEAPNISYGQSSYTFTKNTEVVGETPTNAGGAVSTWAIHPAASTLTERSLVWHIQRNHLRYTNHGYFQPYVHRLGEQFGGQQFDNHFDHRSRRSSLTFRMQVHRSHSPRTPKSLEKHQPTLVVRLARGPFIQQHPPYRAVSCLAHPTEPSTEHQPLWYFQPLRSQFGPTIRRMIFRQPFRSPFKTKQPTFRTRGSPFTFTKNTEVVGETPTNAGGAVSTWAIHPAASTLPSGLLFGTSNGTIYGTPTTVTSRQLFTVWANNSADSNSTTISITVQDEAADISYARFTVHIHQEHRSRWRNTNQRWWCG